MNATTLLATGSTGRRPSTLVDPDVRFSIKGARWDTSDGPMLLCGIWIDGTWAHALVDFDGRLVAMTTGERDQDSHEALGREVARRDYRPADHVVTLLPPLQAFRAGNRRPSQLIDTDETSVATAAVSGKVLHLADGDLLQIRLYTTARWTQLVVTGRLAVAAFATDSTEKQAWKAAQAQLRARGHDLED